MANAVIGPKPKLLRFQKNEEIKDTYDKKGRLFVNTDALVVGTKVLNIIRTGYSQDFRILLYKKDTDDIVGSLYLNSAGDSNFYAIVSTPFGYSIEKDLVSKLILIEDGYIWG